MSTLIRTARSFLYSGAGALAPGVAAGAKSVLFNVPVPADAAAAEAAAASALGIASAHVPIDAPTGLSARTADACVATLASLPRPTLVLCASGNRASAAIAIAEGRAGKWTGEATLAWALEQKMPFLTVQPLRDWVVASVDPAPRPAAAPFAGLVFRQLFDAATSTFTYILGDAASGEAVVIDPVVGKVDRDLSVLNQLGLRAVLALNTHVHADHVSSSFALRAKVPGCRSGIAAAAGAAADVCLADGDAIAFGARALRVIETPGHTAGCLSFALDTGGAVFTGDALLYRGCGRTDFQGGSSAALYASVKERLFALPHDTRVFPGHDYNGFNESTIGEEVRADCGATARENKTLTPVPAPRAHPPPATLQPAPRRGPHGRRL